MPDSKQVQVSKRKPPAAGKGRKKGAVNKTTAVLKDAILLAATQTGLDGAGTGGLVGYLRSLAQSEPKAFSSLLGRVLPLQITGEGGGPVVIKASSEDQAL